MERFDRAGRGNWARSAGGDGPTGWRWLGAAAVVVAVASGCAGAARSAGRSAARGAGYAAGARAADAAMNHFTGPGRSGGGTGAPVPTVAGGATGSRAGSGISRPNPALTPGALNPAVTQANIQLTICVSGWTSTVRPPASVTDPQKLASMRAYGISGPPSAYEFDHDAPLELGGAVDAYPANMWPQPYEKPKGPAAPGTGSQTKDRVENAAHAAVCARRLTLAAAQESIIQDWYKFGQQLGVVAP
jgi:hypothetical protein